MTESYLGKTIGEAQGFLQRPGTKATEVDAVKQDTFDKNTFRQLLNEAPALEELTYQDLGQKYDYTEELVGDVFSEFWQSDPLLRSHKEMHPSFLLNHAVANDMARAPETPQTRVYTKHDKYGAAMATIAVTKKIKESLENAKEAQEAAEAAAAAEQELRDKIRELMENMPPGCFPGPGGGGGDEEGDGPPGGVGSAPADGEGEDGEGGACYFGLPDGAEGPLTADNAQAFEDLVAALQEAQQADLKYEETLAEAQDQAHAVEVRCQPEIRQAIEEAGNMLTDEAELFASWGVEDGVLKRMDFGQRQALASALRRNKMAEYRKLLGRFKMMQAAQSAKKVEFARDEAYDVELSGRLPDVLAGEFALLANEHTRLDFLERLSEDQLLSKKYRGIEKIGQGSIICLVDNSGSMSTKAGSGRGSGPTREAYAKAFALALLDQARSSNRDFVGINFSNAHQISVFRFPKGAADIHLAMRFVEEFYGGGTDFMEPIDRAMEILEAEYNDAGLIKADLCIVTDDDCRVSPQWLAKYKEKKDRLGFRMFGIAVGCTAGNALSSLSDNVRSIQEFTDPMLVADIIRTI
jgi:uncharacterized protein with von Willebrand factor type A (vWA) domain